ncbi:MAG TPA: 30S ribosome-binding factor RbfA [Spirochaetia bacterium]|nr:30S ribosome-binding factor RbfA [Spirochaetaceae bacterium]HOZ72524.1 30S ribosome-binding factor RbfA [Spirochaetales bacterium]HRW23230.1 30S ribosome-binding factor RbfA [Spirochaetia bacterium]HPE89675.1 30S ribosome-binding factor RbfA [Spirochaetales bacterium]HPG86438.1 30S ribosome-binding factor RbfA [Spirochaetales bacterium]
MDEIRRKRVEETLRTEVSALLMRGEIKDPRVDTFLSITRVEVARDGSHAKLYVSTFRESGALDEGVAGLNNAAGFIQAGISKRLRIRLTPRLVFIPDTGIKEGFELGEKIKGLFK